MKHKKLWNWGRRGIYWGARIGGGYYNQCHGTINSDVPHDGDPGAVYNRFVTNAGKVPIMIQHQDSNINTWPPTFTESLVDRVRNRGAFCEYAYGAPTGTSTTGITGLKNNNATAITTLKNNLAIPMRDHGRPILFRPYWERNISGIGAWSYTNLPSDAEYIALWRNTWQAFQDVGATNVSFVWCPNRFDATGTMRDKAIASWPGSEYVDWIGFDGYEGIGSWGDNTYHGPATVFGQAYLQLGALDTTKPMCINEWGVWGGNGSGTLSSPGKSGFMTAFLGEGGWLQTVGTRIKLITYFEDNQFCDANEDSLCFEQDNNVASGCATDNAAGSWGAFRRAIASDYYLTGGTSVVSSTTFPDGTKVPVP